MTTMTKDQAIAYLHHHVTSSHNDDWKTKREAWDVLMAHLAKSAQEWQPIDTAPRDATAILVMRNDWPGCKNGVAEECNGHNTYVAQWWSEMRAVKVLGFVTWTFQASQSAP